MSVIANPKSRSPEDHIKLEQIFRRAASFLFEFPVMPYNADGEQYVNKKHYSSTGKICFDEDT
jgi:hypothetical protein